MGYSGHGRVLLDAVKSTDLKVEGYFQDKANQENPFSLKYMGNESDCTDDFFPNSKFIIGIGDNLIRSKAFKFIKNKKGNIETVIHSTASISNLVEIKEGCFVNTNAIIHIGAEIGNNTIINSGAIVEHDCRIGAHVHIAPGVTLCGNVVVGDYTFIGAGATVIEGVNIGSNVTVGAGSVVVRNIPNNVISVGVPSKIISK
tara:strand:+ start:245 stop:847 length:603 start_codon:yes stop_codon:yes gene_type:complete